MSDKGNAASKISEAAQAQQARRPGRPPAPPGGPRNAQEAMASLQGLANNPQAMGMLKSIFGGQAGESGPGGNGGPVPIGPSGPMMQGQDILYAAIANCVNGIMMSAGQTAKDLAEAKDKLAKQEIELAGFRKQQEAEAFRAKVKNEAMRSASKVLEQALVIANAQGGSKALCDTMVALAQESGIELKPEHIDALKSAKPTTGN